MSADYDGKGIGLRIMQLRQEKGYSRERLAEMTDISAKFLYEIETNRKGFSALILKDIAFALDTSCDFLLMGKSNFFVESKMTAEDWEKVEQLLRLAYEMTKRIG